jgi:hypothetical protein
MLMKVAVAIFVFALGFCSGKIHAIVQMNRWIKSLSDWDQVTVRSLLRNRTRSDENTEFDARMSH